MSRYLLFAGMQYYPCGGIHDLVGAYDTVDAARDALVNHSWDWGHIVDTHMNFGIVYSF